jgi:hypothetical protein
MEKREAGNGKENQCNATCWGHLCAKTMRARRGEERDWPSVFSSCVAVRRAKYPGHIPASESREYQYKYQLEESPRILPMLTAGAVSACGRVGEVVSEYQYEDLRVWGTLRTLKRSTMPVPPHIAAEMSDR